jgi:hypothetical protein
MNGQFGFLSNNRVVPGNREFGSTGYPSKKGVFGLRQTSKLNFSGGEETVSGLTQEAVIQRRTEYLEQQGKTLVATVSNQTTTAQTLQNEQTKISEGLQRTFGSVDVLTKETKRLNDEHEKITMRTQQLFDDSQWVYGKTAYPLKGVECSTKVYKTLHEYRKTPECDTKIIVAPARTWVLLSYPMERVETGEGEFEYLMKVKTVDPSTGQIKICWANVYEFKKNKERRYISKFAISPS